VEEAVRRGMRIVGELETAHAFKDPGALLVAITGTNGKTTTTAWIAHLLREAGLNAVLGGNIGEAWSNSVDAPENLEPRSVFVIEVSSFQLEDIEDFRPDVALLTNLAPDHLDRYPGYDDYVAAKRAIFRNMQGTDALVWNADNAASRGFCDNAKCRVCTFSAAGTATAPGAQLAGGVLCIRDASGQTQELLPRAELPLPGHHNLENALAAALVAHLAGAQSGAIARGLRSFTGVEHRIELCGTRADGVRFYNDSKATNLDSLEKALLSFADPIVLIAGGRDKHSDYGAMRDLVKKKVRHIVTLGEAAPLIEASWGGVVRAERAGGMEDAVRRAAAVARRGEVVLLSPACASYDMYENFEQRGRDFKGRVAALLS
jgi:UDP-N-acetylmuramoylalanine--D-glutamate ligase